MKCCRKANSNDHMDDSEAYSRALKAESADEECPEIDEECLFKRPYTFDLNSTKLPYHWFPATHNVKNIEYVTRMENQFIGLQKAFLALTTHFARVQFRLRQIMNADPEERYRLLCDLEKIAFQGADEINCCRDEMPSFRRESCNKGELRRRQRMVIQRLRNQLSALSEATKLDAVYNEGDHSLCSIQTELEEQDNETYARQQNGSLLDVDGKRSSTGRSSSARRSSATDERRSVSKEPPPKPPRLANQGQMNQSTRERSESPEDRRRSIPRESTQRSPQRSPRSSTHG